MSEQVKLKLVGADRYSCPLIGEEVLEKGGVCYVSQEAADQLLAEKKYDALNNEHDIFLDVTGTPDEEPEEEEQAAPKKAVAASRARPAKK